MTDSERYVDAVLYALSTAMVKAFCAQALFERGETIAQLNEQLATEYMPWLIRWRVQERAYLLRLLDEPTAPTHELQ